MKLWYGPRTRSFTALWMLEETGLPYTLERVDIRGAGHPSAALLAVNPMGKVPALEDGPAKFGDNGAILAWLAEKVPEKKLAPPVGDAARGRYFQWLMFPAGVIEPAMMERFRKIEGNTQQAGWGDMDRAQKALAGAMAPGRWLVGPDFTAADLYIASGLRFGMTFGLVDKLPAFEEFTARASEREAFKRASAIEEKEGAA